MLNRFLASFVLVVLAVLGAGSSAMFAQARQDRFRTKEECLEASEGAFKYYQPSFMTLRREPRSGEEVRELESEACVWMKVVADTTTPLGRAWVRQEKGTRAIYRGIIPVARYDCGNPIYEVAYVPPPPPPVIAAAPAPPPPPEPEPEPQPEFGCVVFQKETTNHLASKVLTVGQLEVFVGDQRKLVPYNGTVRFDQVPVGEVEFGERVPLGYVEYRKVPANGKVWVEAGEECAGVIIKTRQLPPFRPAIAPSPPPPTQGPGFCGPKGWKCWVPFAIAGAGYGIYRATRGEEAPEPEGYKPPREVRPNLLSVPQRPRLGIAFRF